MNDMSPIKDLKSERSVVAAPFPRRSGKRRLILGLLIAIVLIGAGIWYWTSQSANNPAAPAGPGTQVPTAAGGKGRGDPSQRVAPVSAVAARKGSIDVYLYALGTVTPR